MYPILYRKKTKIRFFAALLLLAFCVRLLCAPGARESVWETITAVLRSETLLRTVVFLETGILPNRNEAALPADANKLFRVNYPDLYYDASFSNVYTGYYRNDRCLIWILNVQCSSS